MDQKRSVQWEALKNRVRRIASMPILIPISIRERLKTRNIKKFRDILSVVAIAKNEGPHIREWVEFYKTVGVSRIYLYDNDSTDNMRDEISDYIDSGFVIYTPLPGIARQYDAYMDAINRFKYISKYMAFLDCDEFLMPTNPEHRLDKEINQLFDKLGRGVGGIAVNWRVYGSSGHITKPDGLLLEEYLERQPNSCFSNGCIKTIANPRAILSYQHAHYPIYYAGYRNVDVQGRRVDGAWNFRDLVADPTLLRINHYYTKSREEFFERRSRRVANHVEPMIRSREVLQKDLKEIDSNTVRDTIGLAYATKIHALEKENKNSKNK